VGRLDDPCRLAALERSGLLFRPLPDRLDRLAEQAAVQLGADAGLLNVLDAESQHHLAQWPERTATVTPVEQTGCQLVITAERTVAVPDALTHPVLCRLPWVETWRGYLGAPVLYDAQVLGSLCVLSREPRAWTNYDALSLRALARLVGQALD